MAEPTEWPGAGVQRVLLRDPDPESLAYAVTDAAAQLLPRFAGAARAKLELAAADFPGDIGVVVSVLLNYVRLEPGEAIYLGAGNVHAYLRGTGVEIMANSDNVLRCGLTPKHIDVDELLRITDFVEARRSTLAGPDARQQRPLRDPGARLRARLDGPRRRTAAALSRAGTGRALHVRFR